MAGNEVVPVRFGVVIACLVASSTNGIATVDVRSGLAA